MRKLVTSLMSWDRQIVLDLVPRRSKFLNRYMTAVTMLGDGWIWVAIGLLVLFLHGKSEQLFYQVFFALGLLLGLHRVVKQTCSRLRPFELLKDVACVVPPMERYSFPSGHTAAAFVILATVGVFYSYLFLPLFLLALLIGFSRVYLGVHYPSDVLAGALLGITCAEIARWLMA